MADYIVVNEQNDLGLIAINKNVFKSICEISIADIENAVALEESRFNKPVKIRIEKNQLYVDLMINIKYGANVNATCELVQQKVYENIVFMTGFKPCQVTVTVNNFEIDG